jgi:putative ubiquitin-RnfH superfamily antitoxin RatB of RatAB toxin-antitoxin module
MQAGGVLTVEVVFAPQAGRVDRVSLHLPAGATVGDALHASGLVQQHALDLAGLRVGVWSRHEALDHVLRDRDRVEIYRPLTVDPKEARRLRYKQHRERVARAPRDRRSAAVG